jgi:hypothetical protein
MIVPTATVGPLCRKVLGLYLERPAARSLSIEGVIWGRFGYSDLKGAALRSRSYVFSIGLRRVVWILELVLRAARVGGDRGLWIRVVLRQLQMVVELVLLVPQAR